MKVKSGKYDDDGEDKPDIMLVDDNRPKSLAKKKAKP